ncbi:MAG: hypothetical protein IPJ65_28125 [Archangiaceae bacterium]|nr:hypothetical protein [Archangiaceae bacterium]
MTQEEFGRYWGMSKSVLREKVGEYELLGLALSPDLAVDEHGHLAILVGKAGDFAGRFLVKKARGTNVLDARWCTDDGDWYAWSTALSPSQDE